ncbi:molybdate ABC transporter substrate-binding protein [Agitococcus lubricus]|uniref:Molybdate transport system substrate-binding protein n=1 Tax=Agitococcus lubricus TaxID=1077255 RepID=A0A2T5J241_9GAMM|nr:molybdate ABC transporter substrate-binding protein [Agitococcus lubricus]PTQ90514.1 molybdate transport system substrate-binding protein [Agitococcus lubricus]
MFDVKPSLRSLMLLSGVLYAQASLATEQITLYAAASLTNALTEITKHYQTNHDVVIKTSFAGSSTLAKQIEAGAPAQVFASADVQWMDYLQKRNKLQSNSRKELLGNSLVLITPKNKTISVNMDKSFDLANAFTGKICTGDTASVPVGIYAKQALQNLGWWRNLEKRLVATEDVRTALAFVERGECALGIVYETDAKISDKVTIVGRFASQSHQKIVYPFALVAGASATSAEFFHYLQSDTAQAVFSKYGFVVLKP